MQSSLIGGLDAGELTFQDVLKLGQLSTTGFRNLSEDRTTQRTGQEILDFLVGSTSTAKKDEEKLGLLKGMKTFCDALSASQRARCQDLVKLVEFCNIASEYGCKYVWFDTGCIDKSSSAELEESIRSMFDWYRDAKICIVHLAETTSYEDLVEGPRAFLLARRRGVKGEPWFTRGWTLQELLAPKRILFFGKSWGRITDNTAGNDKVPDAVLGIRLWETISKGTGIDTNHLLNFSAGINHARDALTWVSKRQTTRIEDMAYCLIGLLRIPMSIAYGEGDMAFHRLQVEILQRSGDMGLFAWTGHSSPFNSMLAANAGCFSPLPIQPLITKLPKDTNFNWSQPRSVKRAYMLTNIGLQIPLVVHNANIRRREPDEGNGKPTGLERYWLRLTELDWDIHVVSKDLEVYDHLGIAVLTGLTDETSSLGILLGVDGDRCIRIPTQDHIMLSSIPMEAEAIIRFIE